MTQTRMQQGLNGVRDLYLKQNGEAEESRSRHEI